VNLISRINTIPFLTSLSKTILSVIILIISSSSILFSITYLYHEDKPFAKEKTCQLLKEIYDEIIEFGKYEDEDFIKKEFFIDLDENQENKEEHVVVLQRMTIGKEQMIVQVTYFEPKKINRLIKYAKTTKKILCSLEKENLIIEECGYEKDEIQILLPRILEGIKNKKKLLKLIENKKKQ